MASAEGTRSSSPSGPNLKPHVLHGDPRRGRRAGWASGADRGVSADWVPVFASVLEQSDTSWVTPKTFLACEASCSYFRFARSSELNIWTLRNMLFINASDRRRVSPAPAFSRSMTTSRLSERRGQERVAVGSGTGGPWDAGLGTAGSRAGRQLSLLLRLSAAAARQVRPGSERVSAAQRRQAAKAALPWITRGHTLHRVR